MTPEELTAFYAHAYTKEDLAQLLACFALTGELPPIPHERPQILTFPRGRPSIKDREFKWDLLIEAIEAHYPVNVDLAMLAQECGMLRGTLEKLQDDLAFLVRLEAPYNDYFVALPKVTQARVPVVWRAILDLHHYHCAINDPGVRLPFYTMHALMWTARGLELNLSRKYINQRDAMERLRLTRPEFTQLLDQLNWPHVKFDTAYRKEDEHPWPCPIACPITQAWVQEADVYDIAAVRILIGDMAWKPQQRTYIEARTSLEAIKQITGLD